MLTLTSRQQTLARLARLCAPALAELAAAEALRALEARLRGDDTTRRAA